MKGKDKGSGQESTSNVDAPKNNRFYAPNVMTVMLKVFSIYISALLNPGTTLYFDTPLIGKMFDILPDILKEPFRCLLGWGIRLSQKGDI